MTVIQALNRIRVLVAIVVIAFVVLNCIILFAMAPAHGETRGTPAQRKACTPDVYRLCAGEIPNAARITACLRQHRDRLSEACRAVFEQ